LADSDPDLALVAEVWTDLPQHVRETIMVPIDTNTTDFASRHMPVK
jgi:hypothetical protein